MAAVKQLNLIVVGIMAVITIMNAGLVLNFFTASGQAMAAAFNSQSIFLFAGAEFAAVLLAYVVYKQNAGPANH